MLTITRRTPASPSVPGLLACGADGDADAASRYARRCLELAGLRTRLRGPLAVPVSPIDTPTVSGWLVAFLGTGHAGGAAVRRALVPLTEGRTLAIDVVPATVAFDADELRRALLELVDNAVRNAPAGTTVRVRGASGGTGYQLSVTNTGEPIPRDALAVVRHGGAPGLSPFGSRPEQGLALAAALAAVNGAKLELVRGAGRPNTLRIVARPG